MIEAEIEVLRAKRYNYCLAVMMIDIDFFKGINDLYGHLAGDEVIRLIARACKEKISRTDVIGRYGGEEFAVLLPATSIENAKSLTEQIRIHIEKLEIPYSERKIKVTASIGVSASKGARKEEIDINHLINKADMALYHAKKNGRNCVCSELDTEMVTFSAYASWKS